MDTNSTKTIDPSSELGNALKDNLTLGNDDVVNLHPDEQDKNVANEDVESIEVNVENVYFRETKPKTSLFFKFKNKLLNPEETQPKRAPRPLFMGPVRKNRRSRGARRNANNNNQVKNAPSAPTNPIPSVSKEKIRELSSMATTPNAGNDASATASSGNNAKGTPKRQRSAQSTPENQNRPKRPRTFANIVADNLKLQIVNTTNGINSDQLELIEAKLMKELEKLMDDTTSSSFPTFHTSSFRYGVLKLICTDSFSANWIKNTVENMPPLWDGANLKVKECEPPGNNPATTTRLTQRQSRREPPVRRPTIRFFIPDGVKRPTFEAVEKKLHLQNNPLSTNDWIDWKAEDRGDGIFYHVSVNEPDINFIRARMDRLFYCFNKIKINLPRE